MKDYVVFSGGVKMAELRGFYSLRADQDEYGRSGRGHIIFRYLFAIFAGYHAIPYFL